MRLRAAPRSPSNTSEETRFKPACEGSGSLSRKAADGRSATEAVEPRREGPLERGPSSPSSLGEGADHEGAARRGFLRSGLLEYALSRSRASSSGPMERYELGWPGSYFDRMCRPLVPVLAALASSDNRRSEGSGLDDAAGGSGAAKLPLPLRADVGLDKLPRLGAGTGPGPGRLMFCALGETAAAGERRREAWTAAAESCLWIMWGSAGGGIDCVSILERREEGPAGTCRS